MKKKLVITLILLFTLVGCTEEIIDDPVDTNCEIETVDDSNVEDYSYNIVTTYQTEFYNNTTTITEPLEGEDFYGQDATYDSSELLYQDNCDGTVTDLNTGLMWTKSADINDDGVISGDDKLTYDEAITSADEVTTGGYDDWRVPTIKELYSLIIFSGLDVSGYESDDTSDLTPFIDDSVFEYSYGLTDEGERIIDSQYVSSTTYYYDGLYDTLIFGVNFADGRIKGYGETGMDGNDKTFFVIYVRGNEDYGVNDYTDNTDGTVTDQATGLMWMSTGSTDTFTWEEALEYAENYEYAGYDDWRLPDIKELQSIVDYSRSPDTTNSPAIDELFTLTSFLNEDGGLDFGYYWSSTTHNNYQSAGNAAYISFGRALGYMNNNWLDVHGAGAQRSDPKSGDASAYPTGHGPQGDAIRIENYVILVRDTE